MLPVVFQFIAARVNKRQSGIVLENLTNNALSYLVAVLLKDIIFTERGGTGFNPSPG
jgi:hypothetical protein